MSQIKLPQTDAEWRAWLIAKNAEPLAFEVTRRAATERPFTGKYETHWEPGHYNCMCCDAKLLTRRPNLTQDAVGPLFTKRLNPMLWLKRLTAAMAWLVSKAFAPNVALIWVMCLKMAPSQPDFVTA